MSELWNLIQAELEYKRRLSMTETTVQQPDLWLDVIREMEARRQRGLETYGKPVTPDDAHDWLKEAEQEAYDFGIYCRAARLIVDRMRLRIAELEDTVATLKDLLREGNK
jgi:hypothetical protein